MGRAYDIMRDEAWATTGRKWRRVIVAWEISRAVAPWAAGAALIGAAGYAAWWAWTAWVLPMFTPDPSRVNAAAPAAVAADHGSVPVWVWVTGLALLGYLLWLFRPGRVVVYRQRRMVQVMAIGFAFAGLLGVTLFGMTH
jgi:hypothetical protein